MSCCGTIARNGIFCIELLFCFCCAVECKVTVHRTKNSEGDCRTGVAASCFQHLAKGKIVIRESPSDLADASIIMPIPVELLRSLRRCG